MLAMTKHFLFLKTFSLNIKLVSGKAFNRKVDSCAKIEKFKKSLDQRSEYAALLIDRSKAFDCLPTRSNNSKTVCLGT